MARGRPRRHDPTIPAHIDQAKLPAGVYWDKSGNGRWYLLEAHPEGGPRRRKTIASARARLSELHDIIELRNGSNARGTLAWLHEQFQDSTEYAALAKATRRDYLVHGDLACSYPTKLGYAFGQIRTATLTTPVIQQLVEQLAKARPESRPGADDARTATPSTANHVLRYLRRLFAWGIRFGHCTDNPARGVKQAKEASKAAGAASGKMPAADAFGAVLAFARERGARTAHTEGSCPAYLAPVMQLAYTCRLRGVEVTDLTDADILEHGLRCRRRKGSLTNVTAWTPALRGAVAELQTLRNTAIKRVRGALVTPLRAEDRPLLAGQDGAPLRKSSLDSAWQRLIALAIDANTITAAQRFSLHGLKHKGVTDTAGTRAQKKDASGHRTDAAVGVYDHEVKLVPAAGEQPVEHCKSREFSGEFSGGNKKGTEPRG